MNSPASGVCVREVGNSECFQPRPRLRPPDRAVYVNRVGQYDLVAVAAVRDRGHVGDRRESRIVGRGRVHVHLVADRKRPVQSAAERVHPAEMLGAVFGRRLRKTENKTKTVVSMEKKNVQNKNEKITIQILSFNDSVSGLFKKNLIFLLSLL